MPQAKLKIASVEAEKLAVAAELSNVKTLKGTKYGETVVVEVSARNVSDLFEMGKTFAQLPADTKLQKVEAEAPKAEAPKAPKK